MYLSEYNLQLSYLSNPNIVNHTTYYIIGRLTGKGNKTRIRKATIKYNEEEQKN